MVATCLSGLQGYPIQVTDWIGEQNKDQYSIPNDISLQFSPNKVPIKYVDGKFNFQGSNTFVMGGTQYNLRLIRPSIKKQEGLTLRSDSSVQYELHFWGTPVVNALDQYSLGLLVIPVFTTPISTSGGKAVIEALKGEAVSLLDFFPQSKDVLEQPANIIRYATCIETDKEYNITLSVAYWVYGIGISQTDMNAIKSFSPQPYGIPQFSDYKILTTYEQTVGGKGERQYKVRNGLLQSYTNSVALSVAAPEIKNSFRYIQNFVNPTTTAQQSLTNMKCIKIDRSRDVKNGKLLLDPATGERLEDMEKEAKDSEAIDAPQVEVSTRKVLDIILICIGITIGILLLGLLCYGIYYFMITRKSLGIPPEPENVIRLAEAMGTQQKV